MPKSDYQKTKLLLIREYLEQYTDPEHPASTPVLQSWLEQHGIHAERKSVYNDIQTLEDYGLDILKQTGQKGGFSLGERTFELSELKLLADAVLSSRFLSERKSAALIRKLETLTSVHNAKQLHRQLVVTGRVKSMNESVLYNVDTIHQAIAAGVQITFRYFDWTPKKERSYRGGTRKASPYALCWDNACYYLIAHTQEHGLTHFRVDKMNQINLTSLPRVQTEETKNLNLSDYSRQVFSMFGGELRNVRMQVENRLAGVILDQFGRDVTLVPDGEDSFICVARVRVSPTFLGWVAGFGGRIRLLSPEDVVEQYTRLLQKCLGQETPPET